MNSTTADAAEMFLRAEHAGLKLAIIGRIAALALMGIWLIGTRADDPTRALGYVLVLSVFAVLGLAHYALIGTRFDRGWVKYVFITLDIAIVSALVATQPLYQSAAGLPAVMTFRAPVFPFYFVILGVAAFSFSPVMVMWTGIAGAIGWLLAFRHAASRVDGVRNWSEIPNNPTAEQIMAIVLDPRFGGLSGRIQEAVLLAVVAFLIAVVMWRARTTLRRQLQSPPPSSWPTPRTRTTRRASPRPLSSSVHRTESRHRQAWNGGLRPFAAQVRRWSTTSLPT